MLYVIKRDGREVDFNADKIGNAIKKASNEIGQILKESEVLGCIQKVIKYIELEKKEKVSVEEVQNLVEKALIDSNYKNIQKAYSAYRKERTRIRDIKSDLMKVIEKIGVEQIEKGCCDEKIRRFLCFPGKLIFLFILNLKVIIDNKSHFNKLEKML